MNGDGQGMWVNEYPEPERFRRALARKLCRTLPTRYVAVVLGVGQATVVRWCQGCDTESAISPPDFDDLCA